MGFEDGEDDNKGRWDPRTRVTLHWPDSSQCPRGKGSWGPRGRYALSTGGSKPVPLRGREGQVTPGDQGAKREKTQLRLASLFADGRPSDALGFESGAHRQQDADLEAGCLMTGRGQPVILGCTNIQSRQSSWIGGREQQNR